MRVPIAAILLLAAAPVPALDLDRELARRAGGREAPGIALVVATQGEIAFVGTAGFADRDARTPLGEDTLLPLGELSRTFTAALALTLEAEGRLTLDAPLSAWIGNDEVDFDPSTTNFRQLLAHVAGLPPARLRGMYRDADAPFAADAALAAGDFYQALPPGLLVSPSALGYTLAAKTMERAAGDDYESLLRSRLLEPLGLHDTGFVDRVAFAPTHTRGRAQPGLVARDRAAVGLASSPRDLARWLAALTAPDSPLAQRDRLFATQSGEATLSFDERMGLGFGLAQSIVEGTGRIAFVHSGYPGYRAQVRIAVDHGVGVLALSNGSDSYEALAELVDMAFDAHLGRSGQAVEEARRERERVPASVPRPAAARPVAPATRYATAFGMVTVLPAERGFDAEVFGRRFSARPREDGWMEVRYRLFGFIPLAFSVLNRVLVMPAEVDGHHVLLAWFGGRTLLLGSAFEAPPVPAEARRLAGEWTLESPDALVERLEIRSAQLGVEDGLLSLGYELPFVLTLRPRLALGMEAAGHLRLLGTGPGLGERIRVGQDSAGDWLEYSGYRLRRVSP